MQCRLGRVFLYTAHAGGRRGPTIARGVAIEMQAYVHMVAVGREFGIWFWEGVSPEHGQGSAALSQPGKDR